MKVKRYKKVNKYLRFFINNFGFRQPYQVLVDGTFCYCALNNKVNIADNLPRYLQGEIKLLTTQCTIVEMENLGPKLNGALLVLKQYSVHKCGHEGKPISGSKCFLSMLEKTNPSHYIIATQDRDLQDKARRIPGAPLIYLHMKTPVLEKPSDVSVKLSEEKFSALGASEKSALEELKLKSGLLDSERKFRKRKKKGVNPLSCKKKKKKVSNTPSIKNKESQPEIEKKKRKRVRLPKHVKEALLQTKTNLTD